MTEMDASPIRWPTNSDRTFIAGRTGSGKSVFGLWLLSTRNFDEQPWIIFDYKRDPLIRQIEQAGAREIALTRPPTKAGLYIVRPDPDEPAIVNQFLRRVWDNQNTGLFFDEGFMVPQHRPYKAFDGIMTQGRSMNIPVIMLYQRPVTMSQFTASQSDFFGVFHLIKKEDREKVGEYMGELQLSEGRTLDVNSKLPPYWCLWYDVGRDRLDVLRPCPSPQSILETFGTRLEPLQQKRGWLF